MKLAALTQRVQVDPAHGERRDCLDQRWDALLGALGYVGVALPNLPSQRAEDLLESLRPALIVLTGGNTPSAAAPDAPDAAPERDAFEAAVLAYALRREIPVLGVCRGMQLINLFFGGTLNRAGGHVATRHAIHGEGAVPAEVNSYHDWGIAAAGLAEPLEALAVDDMGNVEALRHRAARVAGIMWHPEREAPLREADLDFIRSLL